MHAPQGAQSCGTVAGTTSETAAPAPTSKQAPPGASDPGRGNQPSQNASGQALEFPTLARMREQSTGTARQHRQTRTEGTEKDVDEEMTENSEPGEPGATQPPTAHPSPAPPQPGPSDADVPTGQRDNNSGRTPPAWHPCWQGQGGHASPTPQTTTTREHGPP